MQVLLKVLRENQFNTLISYRRRILRYLRYTSSRKSIFDENDPNKFVAKMGAEAVYDLLAKTFRFRCFILRFKTPSKYNETSNKEKRSFKKTTSCRIIP
jgi:hypothetical protein